MSQQIAFTGHLGRPSAPSQAFWNLYLVDAAQAAPQQLTGDLLIPRFSWSPDGQALAFIAWSSLGGKRVETLYVLEPGHTLRRLTDAKGSILWNWSPDGKQLAFTCLEEAISWHTWPSPRGALFVMHRERDELRQLTSETAYVAWSQQTNEIACCWKHDNHTITVLNADGTNPRLFFHSPLRVMPYSWSPNGQFLACNVASRSHWGAGQQDADHFHVFDVQGKLIWQQAGSVVPDALAWSPDSQRLALVASSDLEDDDEQPCVYVVGRDGSGLRPLGLTKFETDVAWSPDNLKIAYTGYDRSHHDPNRYTLEVHEVDSQHNWSYPMNGMDSTGDVYPHTPTWSPDSQQLAYNGPGHHDLHLVKLTEPFPSLFTGNGWQPFDKERQDRDDSQNLIKPRRKTLGFSRRDTRRVHFGPVGKKGPPVSVSLQQKKKASL